MIKRIIPSSGEQLPVIGLGTWSTFDVSDTDSKNELSKILKAMYTKGGSLIDSSPMYGKSEQVVGELTSGLDTADKFFYATKIWTTGELQGRKQIEESMKKMQRDKIDLMQIHNLNDWETHLPLLQQKKEKGEIRYIGITHYTDSSHEELERILRTEKIDFVQFNYSILSRHAEKRLLDAAADLGVATLINRPLGEGNLFSKTKGKSLPPWAKEFQIESWSAYFLKYLIAHPAVTCVIPATGNLEHALDNLKAGVGELPDNTMRNRMIEYLVMI